MVRGRGINTARFGNVPHNLLNMQQPRAVTILITTLCCAYAAVGNYTQLRHNYPAWNHTRQQSADQTYIDISYSDRWRTVTNAPEVEKERSSTLNISQPVPQSDRVVVEMPGSLATDQDLHFALSLVPMLRARTMSDKLGAQIDILTYFKTKLARDQK